MQQYRSFILIKFIEVCLEGKLFLILLKKFEIKKEK